MPAHLLANVLNSFGKHLFSILFLRFLAILLHFLASIFVVRYLGEEIAGVYFTAFAIIMIVGVVGRLGTENALVKVVSELVQESKLDLINENVFFIGLRVLVCTLLLSIATAVVAIIAEYYGWFSLRQGELHRTLIVFSIGLFAYNFMIVVAQAFLGKQRQVFSIIYLNLLWLSLFLVLQVFIKPASSVNMAWLFNVSVVICSFVSMSHWFYIAGIPRSMVGVARKKIVMLSSNLFAAEFSQQLTLWAPIIVIGFYLTGKDVTEYTIASRIAMVSIVVMQASNAFFSPKFSGLMGRESIDSVYTLYCRAMLFVVVLSLPVMLVLFIWSDKFISLYGVLSGKATEYLHILLIGQLFNVFGGVAAIFLVMNGGDRFYKATAFMNVVLTIGLSIFLCSVYGALGVAMGVSISLVVSNILVLYFMKKLVGFWRPFLSKVTS